jgi:hypothetical protein
LQQFNESAVGGEKNEGNHGENSIWFYVLKEDECPNEPKSKVHPFI